MVAQNLEPNTEIKYTFQKDEEGNEEDGLISSQTVEEILLYVEEVGDSGNAEISMTSINTSPDAYTYYIRDYVGRNLNECGYLSMGGQLRDAYGAATVQFVLIPDDGSYIDPKDEETIKKYKVNTTLLVQAEERAKNLLEGYVKNVGEQIGEEYTVKWVEIE